MAPPTRIRAAFATKDDRLQDDATLAECGVATRADRDHATPPTREFQQWIDIRVRTETAMMDNCLELRLEHSNNEAESLREALRHRMGLRPEQDIELYLDGQPFESRRHLWQVDLDAEDAGIIIVDWVPCEAQIRLLSGNSFSVGFWPPTDTVNGFAKRLNQEYWPKTALGTRSQRELSRLYFEGIHLPTDDDTATIKTTMQDYNMTENSIVYALTQIKPASEMTTSVQDNTARGCTIAKAELRGITLRQLKDIASTILRRCSVEKWTGTDPSQPQGTYLKPEDVTLYDLVQYNILPATNERQCSYVEVIADGPQRPKWFVSHWWGETVFHFIACLEQHAVDHSLGEDAPYWVCAYATNQHNLEGELGTDPQEGPFRRAMHLTQGTVSILDRNATCFCRIWCIYELFMALVDLARRKDDNGDGYLYDVYTISGSENNSNAMALLDDDSDFPIEVCRQAMNTNILNAEASLEKDKRCIMNSICGIRLDGEPPKSHPAYDELNALIRGRFAVVGYSRAVKAGEDMVPYRRALSDYACTQLEMSFTGDSFSKEAPFFVTSLPPTLRELKLCFWGASHPPSEEYANGFGKLSNLQQLSVCMSCDSELTWVDGLWEGLGGLRQLCELELDFRHCKTLPDDVDDGLGKALSSMTDLRFLSLDLRVLSSLEKITAAIALRNKKLTRLNLGFEKSDNFPEDHSIVQLCRVLVQHESLEELYLRLPEQSWLMSDKHCRRRRAGISRISPPHAVSIVSSMDDLKKKVQKLSVVIHS